MGEQHDSVNHPKHYTSDPSGVECIQITRHRNFNIGNAIKYLWRAGLKDSSPKIEDLKKAVWYIQDEIKRVEALAENQTVKLTVGGKESQTANAQASMSMGNPMDGAPSRMSDSTLIALAAEVSRIRMVNKDWKFGSFLKVTYGVDHYSELTQEQAESALVVVRGIK